MKPKIICISGGSGSGKTFISNEIIKTYIKENIALIKQDYYYKDLSHVKLQNRINHNFDHPNSIDLPLFKSQIKKLTLGKNIKIPTYDFSKHIRLKETTQISNKKLIIVDGLFTLYYKQLHKFYNFKIYIKTPKKLRLQRRIHRDIKERDRTLESIIYQYNSTVKHMHKKFIKPSKKHADLIINGDRTINKIMKIIKPELDSILA